MRDAFGERWVARVTWSYWVNVAVWLPAIFILFAGVLAQIFFPDLSLRAQIAFGINLSWICVARLPRRPKATTNARPRPLKQNVRQRRT